MASREASAVSDAAQRSASFDDVPDVVLGGRGRLQARAAPEPTALACLHCQLIGKRRMLCSKADACEDLPLSFAMGPVLLGAWLVMTIAFIVAVR